MKSREYVRIEKKIIRIFWNFDAAYTITNRTASYLIHVPIHSNNMKISNSNIGNKAIEARRKEQYFKTV